MATYLVSLIQYYFISFVYSYSRGTKLGYTHCPEFLYKWSWGFCVMQMHCHEHKREEYKQFTPMATYLLSLIQYYFISFVYSYSFVQKMTKPHCPDFLYKWSWGFCIMQMHCHEHKREEYKQYTPLATYLVSLIQ